MLLISIRYGLHLTIPVSPPIGIRVSIWYHVDVLVPHHNLINMYQTFEAIWCHRLFAFQYTNLLSIDTYQNYEMSKPDHAIGCLLFNMRICCRSIAIKTMICRSHIMPQAVSFSIYEFVVDRYLSKLWYVEAVSCHRLFAFEYTNSLSIDTYQNYDMSKPYHATSCLLFNILYKVVVDRYLYCSDR